MKVLYFHELGHARYLIDVYGFDVNEDGTGGTVAITENGSLVAGTPMMPIIGSGVYSTPVHGLMNGQYTYIDHYSSPALNLIAGHRATYGNYNAPNNIGVFMEDLPENNIITFKDNQGNILPDADIKIFQAGPKSGVWYGKYYDNTPDLQFTTDSLGSVNVGRCPFSQNGTITHDYGFSNSIAIVRVAFGGLVGYSFLAVSSFNLKYWAGDTLTAAYDLNVNLVNPSGLDDQQNLLDRFALEQNYPNPFNPDTRIGYQIATRSNVTLIVYDLLGREIKTLVNKNELPGLYSVKWDGTNNNNLPVSSGIYFYRMEAGNIVLNRKMILLK